ncbi:MAG TPA: hypothetical protein PKV72_00050 [Candidatus Peribacteria bacterium]|nr:hypothetical protein [Candidatus Peribacteria bacterium]
MSEVELEMSDGGKAVIEGKTNIPFKTFVGLILQRKVQTLFKKCGDEPVIVDSELLTQLASAPNDSQEDRTKLVLVTFGVGVLCGVFLAAVGLLVLLLLKIQPSVVDYGIAVGVMLVLGIIVSVLQRMQLGSTKQKLYDSMEKMTDLVSR